MARLSAPVDCNNFDGSRERVFHGAARRACRTSTPSPTSAGPPIRSSSRTLTADQFTANTTDSAHRIVYETDTGKLFYDSNGSAAGGSVPFAVVAVGLELSSLDFLVV